MCQAKIKHGVKTAYISSCHRKINTVEPTGGDVLKTIYYINQANIKHANVTTYCTSHQEEKKGGASCLGELSENDRHKSGKNQACCCCCCCCPAERPLLLAACSKLRSRRQPWAKSRLHPSLGWTHGHGCLLDCCCCVLMAR